MYSADSGGLHTDVYLVGLHRDVQIEQSLALETQLERRLGNHNSCSLSKDRYKCNIPRYKSSIFTVDCRDEIILVGFGLKHSDYK